MRSMTTAAGRTNTAMHASLVIIINPSTSLEYNGKKFSRTLRHLNALAHDQGYKGVCLANLGELRW